MSLQYLDKYDDESKAFLTAVIRAVREQYIVNGCQSQFWFYPCQVSDAALTSPIIEKWINVLQNNGLLYYYRATGTELEQDLALTQRKLGDNHTWGEHMFIPFVYGFPAPPSSPRFALDIGDTDLDQLLGITTKTALGLHFYVDKIGNIHYDNNPLSVINSSKACKAVLLMLLKSKNNTATVEEVISTLESLSDTENIYQKRNEVISDIRKELFSVSQHKVNLESHKSGRRIDYYFLSVNEL